VAVGFLAWIVPGEVVVAVGKVYVCFFEDGGPLEWCSMETLTGSAVAVFSIERFLAT